MAGSCGLVRVLWGSGWWVPAVVCLVGVRWSGGGCGRWWSCSFFRSLVVTRVWVRGQSGLMLRYSSWGWELSDSVEGFFQGSPGGMNSIPVRVPARSVVAAAIVSGSLSSRGTAGG